MPDAPNGRRDLDQLISACCAGDSSASSDLRNALRPGIRFLLERHGANPSLAEGILTQVLREVAEGIVIRQSELLRRTRHAAREVVADPARTRPSSPGLRLVIPDRDREMLRSYYVDGENVESICRRLSVSPAAFEAAKRRLREPLPTPGRDLSRSPTR